MRKQLDISTQQAVLVYGLLGPRLSCVVDQLSSGGVKLSVEAWYPEWWGGPSGMGVLK